MKVERLRVDPGKARELWRAYREHLAFMTKADEQIAAIYKRLAQGRTVIRALASIQAAGLDEQGLPRLAIARADERQITCVCMNDQVRFEPHWRLRSVNRVFNVSIPGTRSATHNARAAVPLIPVHLRPRTSLAAYHILWEADWQAYPRDPYLLRRFGADAWLVVAAWDLTPVERAVMSQRVSA